MLDTFHVNEGFGRTFREVVPRIRDGDPYTRYRGQVDGRREGAGHESDGNDWGKRNHGAGVSNGAESAPLS